MTTLRSILFRGVFSVFRQPVLETDANGMPLNKKKLISGILILENMRKLMLIFLGLGMLWGPAIGQKAVRIGIAGLTHSHVLPLLRNLDRDDIQIVGIAESNRELLYRYAEEYSLNREILFTSLEEMMDKTQPEGVVTFTSIFDHYNVVKACAPRGIHVMVEKPMAVSVRHAGSMVQLARKHGILLLTNYETTWYPSVYACREMVERGDLGKVRKIMVYDGHKGPREIRVNEEFLDWLTDPVLNGGGALTDFGCYGADLMTWLMKGRRPVSVTATLQQFKPEVYPRVDDDATILLTYPEMTGIILASWNWPFNRKDMHIYGTTGYVFSDDARHLRYRLDEGSGEKSGEVPVDHSPFPDGFSFFAAAIRNPGMVSATDLSSPEINLTVVEILEAARKSFKAGKTIKLRSK